MVGMGDDMTKLAKIEDAPLPAAAPADEASALISMIERAARDPNVDIVKMERLFDMRERVAARAAEAAFNAAMAAAQAEIAPVAKNKSNTHNRSKYADLYAIADKALPVAHKHGFGLSFSEFRSEIPNHLGVACKVTHAAGHSERYEFNVPVDAAGSQGKVNKTATQAYGSTFTYGRRYATCGVFNIAIKDDDGNAHPGGNGMVTEDQVAELNNLISETQADAGWICEHYSIETLADMTTKQFGEAKSGLTARLKGQQKAKSNG